MEQCESKIGGACARPAIWKQSIRAGQRDTGRILMYSNWCDEHAENIARKRLTESLPPPTMARLADE